MSYAQSMINLEGRQTLPPLAGKDKKKGPAGKNIVWEGEDQAKQPLQVKMVNNHEKKTGRTSLFVDVITMAPIIPGK